MAEVALPLPADIMYPTLQAVVSLGGTAEYADVDDLALKLAAITPQQFAVEYGEDATATGPKVLHRMAWARSMLKRIGALEGAGHGVWAVTERGEDLASLPEGEARTAIALALSEAYETIEPDPDTLVELRKAAQNGSPVSMPTRQLIKMWGANRRRVSVVERVNRALATLGLRTAPDFALGGLGSVVEIVLIDDGPLDGATSSGPVEVKIAAVELVVGNLPSATNGVVAVAPGDTLLAAQSKMRANDYSQLAMMGGPHNLQGAVSWESIAKARMVNPNAQLEDCVDEEAGVVPIDRPLLDTVPAIYAAGFVFVADAHNVITGIITAADLSLQFSALAKPFIILGDIERTLRTAVDRCFSVDDLYGARDPEDDREVEGAHSLTLGEVQRLLESESNFGRLNWHADRKVVIDELNRARTTRNEVMHFSPDPLDAAAITQLAHFSNWVRQLEALAASA